MVRNNGSTGTPFNADGVSERVTIYDVAKAAGVAPSTVSKALAGKGRTSPETRDRIAALARQLGYQAPMRQPLPRGDATVGLLTLDGYGRFTPTILAGVEDALSPMDCSVVLCDARRDPVRQAHYLTTLIDRKVDGLIVTGRATDPVAPLPMQLPFPVVYAYQQCHDAPCQITSDDFQGGELAGRQLQRDGRRKIVALTGPPNVLAARERLRGLTAAAEAGGVELVANLPGPFTERSGSQLVEDLLRSGLRFDGLYCANDQIARGAADALAAAGRRVPDDLAIVGFDNWTLLAGATRPPLTSIDMNLYTLGRRAGEHLLLRIDGAQDVVLEKIACSIAVRASCPAPVDGDPLWHPSTSPMIPDA